MKDLEITKEAPKGKAETIGAPKHHEESPNLERLRSDVVQDDAAPEEMREGGSRWRGEAPVWFE